MVKSTRQLFKIWALFDYRGHTFYQSHSLLFSQPLFFEQFFGFLGSLFDDIECPFKFFKIDFSRALFILLPTTQKSILGNYDQENIYIHFQTQLLIKSKKNQGTRSLPKDINIKLYKNPSQTPFNSFYTL